MSFEEKKENLINQMQELVKKLIKDGKGVESKHTSDIVMKPEDKFQFNIDGYPSGSYVTEVKEDKLVSNYGHSYDYEVIGIDELCELIDHLKNKYGEDLDVDVTLSQKEKLGILQLVNDNINSRECDNNELGYLGLINLKNKLQD